MRRLPPDIFDKPWLLLCEGEADRLFFNKIIRDMGGFGNKFEVRFPSRSANESGGRSKFGTWIGNVIDTSSSFKTSVKAILIASDSDLNHDESFKEVLEALKKHNKIALPAVPEVFSKKPGHPDIFILMIPRKRSGCLETHCVSAAYNKWPNIKSSVENLLTNSDANNWSLTKKDKMRIQSIVSCTCEAKPEAGLSGHWQENERYHIPVNDPVFQEIRDAISLFASGAPT